MIGSALWSLLYNGVPVHTITRGLHRFGKFSRVPEPEPQSQEDTEETPDEGYVGYVVKLVRDSFNYVSANVDLGALVTGASAHPLGDSTSALEASTRVPTQTTVSEEGAKQTSISGAALSDDELLRRVTIQRLRDCIMQTIADSYHFAEVKGDDVFTHRFHFVVASKAFAAHGMGCKMSEAAGVASDIYVSGVRMEDYSLCADETIET